MQINIKTIKPEKQRYPTVGDYWYDEEGVLQIRVTDLGDEFLEKLIVIHELIEEALTKKKGLSEPEIMDFDLAFEKRRDLGLVDKLSEPGFDNDAPYLKEHTFATSVEMGMCALAGISWTDYSKKVDEI